ncbi:unnamed protein product [Medioppia subpectinata]|uniref:Uncharacterized protein n=1 Tax=Medioppia subpectinata TaxID=1979941 RepID=A0A7R9L0B3_9ACAR|nr:unnamed protein product [Medioppia subpectinata]CAG2111956.1 unnamed protein product [Medioppia subpectinata]
MFEKLLPKDINIYVTVSSGGDESSYLCWEDDDIGVYLSDPYTAAWLYDSEHKDLTRESLQEQYLYIQYVINKTMDPEWPQHPHQFGDLSIAKLPVSQFMGPKNPPKPLNTGAKAVDNCDAIPSQDVFIYMKQKQILSAKDISEKQRY